MKLYCKCGHCLTKDLAKVSYKEAYYRILESIEKVYGEDGVSEEEFDNSQWGVKAGTYVPQVETKELVVREIQECICCKSR